MEMSYQTAGMLRDKSLSSLITENILSGGGILGSISHGISQKTQANVTGIKEKFDPLNIAKFLTGGSNLAPAILGKLTGRKKQDIHHFAGKPKLSETASKLGPLESGNEMNDVLMRIYSFMLKTSEEDKLRSEQERDFAEEQSLEKERRHKKLIDALMGKKVSVENVPTADKIPNEEPTPVDSLLSILEEKLFGKLFDRISDSILNKFKKWFALSEVLGGATLPSIAMVHAALLAPWLLNAYQRTQIEKDPNNPEWKDTPYAKMIRGEAKTQGEAAAQNKRNVTSKSAGGGGYVPSVEEAKNILENGNQKDWDAFGGKQKLMDIIEADKKSKTKKSEKPSQEKTVSQLPNTPSAIEPVDNTSSGQILSKVTDENLNIKIPESKPDPSSAVVNNNTVQNKVASGNKIPMPSVRNMESTFQYLIMESTRVV